ncbi:quinon protein alcohol dehydrogenase-like superfamily [Zopfochytrium polystomum]|nr:quinon protein alcohol dehydrogenase-like superfamily [Zopfochytrium polystomum]
MNTQHTKGLLLANAEDSCKIAQIAELFDSCSSASQIHVLQRLLSRCRSHHLLRLSSVLSPLLKVDFIANCPPEVSIKILHYLDAKSLCHAAQVSSLWQRTADADVIWHRMCEQHIDKKCAKCGWGLPLIRSGRTVRPAAGNSSNSQTTIADGESAVVVGQKRRRVSDSSDDGDGCKPYPVQQQPTPPPAPQMPILPSRRSWKSIYAERLVVERNWRRAQYDLTSLTGHTGPILCMHFDECLSLLMTGSADRSIKVWCTETGSCINTIYGHTGSVTGVQFDDNKIVSCSQDASIRIWNRKTFECVHTLIGHTGAVNSVHLDDKVLASGSSDSTIRIWSVANNKCSILRGHGGPVNKVHIFQKTKLFSCSNDGTAKLWDLDTRMCLRTFSGHTQPIQSLHVSLPMMRKALASSESRGGEPKLVTASLDSKLKVWDIQTGECLKTLYGHERDVRCVAADTLRIVSGSDDGALRVWDVESGKCLYSIGRGSGVRCCALSDTKIVVGREDGLCKIFSFAA